MVEIKTSILGELQKIRSGCVYDSVEAVMDELVQNAKRAGATEVNLYTHQPDNDSFVITLVDNGCGCDDPQDLFYKHVSGWENCPEAFGEGFFSLFSIADDITIWSNGWTCSFNVDDLLDGGNLTLDIEPSDEVDRGFKVDVLLKNFDDGRLLENEFKKLALWGDIEFKVNGNQLTTSDFCSLDDFDYEIRHGIKPVIFDNELVKGVLTPSKFSNWFNIDFYHDGRPLAGDGYFNTFVEGRLDFKEGVVDFKAPDRKHIINNNKFKSFENHLHEMTRQVFLENLDLLTTGEVGWTKAFDAVLDPSDWGDVVTVIPSKILFNETLFDGEYAGNYMESSDFDPNMQVTISELKAECKHLFYTTSDTDLKSKIVEALVKEGVAVANLCGYEALSKAFKYAGIRNINNFRVEAADDVIEPDAYSETEKAVMAKIERWVEGTLCEHHIDIFNNKVDIQLAYINQFIKDPLGDGKDLIIDEPLTTTGIDCIKGQDRYLTINKSIFTGFICKDNEVMWRVLMQLMEPVCEFVTSLIDKKESLDSLSKWTKQKNLLLTDFAAYI